MLDASDLIQPFGEVNASVATDVLEIEESELRSWISEYLNAAYTKIGSLLIPLSSDVVKDTAAANYAYARLYRAMFTAVVAEPASQSLSDEGSVSYSRDQAEQFRRAAESYQADFDAVMTAAVTTVASSGTVAIRTRVAW